MNITGRNNGICEKPLREISQSIIPGFPFCEYYDNLFELGDDDEWDTWQEFCTHPKAQSDKINNIEKVCPITLERLYH
jgi:hypothetical protein